jgi:hypothetical protein
MPTQVQIASWLYQHLVAQPERVARVLAGPKRETWFSTEFFIAVSSMTASQPPASGLPDFSCYGEQNYATIMNLLRAQAPAQYGSHRPDLVIQDWVGGINPAAIIEVKLILKDENPKSELQKLASQLNAAKTAFPQANVLGIALLAHAPHSTPSTFSSAESDFKKALLAALPQPNFDWVTGFDVKQVFLAAQTGFKYPNMSVSLSMAVRARQ